MPNGSLRFEVVPADHARLLTGPMTLAGLALAACGVTRLSGLDHAGLSFCYFKALTGHACFTCGTTRAFGHLSRFDVPGAFMVQPLVTVGILAVLAWGALDTLLLAYSMRSQVRIGQGALRWALGVGVAMILANWIYLLSAGV